MKLRTNDKLPMSRSTIGGCYVCGFCGHRVSDRSKPGDKGTFPRRNRARGIMVKHLNDKHSKET